MKQLSLFFASLLASVSAAWGATVNGNTLNTIGTQISPYVRFIPQSTRINGTNIVLGFPVGVQATNGQFSATNLVGGWYNVDFGSSLPLVPILVPLNDNNTYDFSVVAQLSANAQLFDMTNLVVQVGGGSATNVWFLNSGSATWSVVNGSNQVTVTGFDASGAAVSVTNGYPWGSLYDSAGAAHGVTNGYPWSSLYDAAGAAVGVTNGYPWSSRYDSAGTAVGVTNGYPWSSLYDTAGAAHSVTNGFPWSVLYDPVGAALGVTNGYPWNALNDPLNSAKNATNNIGPGSGLAAFAPTNQFDAAGSGTSAATGATNAIGKSSGLAAFAPTNQFDASGSASAATNAIGIASGLAAMVPTNAFLTSGGLVSSTNNIGLPSGFAAFVQTNRFDVSGSAQGATNAIGLASGLAAMAPTNQFDPSGAAHAATNGYVWGSLYDPVGAALGVTNGYPWGALYDSVGSAHAVTNGYPWSSLYDSAGTAIAVTNGIGRSTGLAAMVPTNQFDWPGMPALLIGPSGSGANIGFTGSATLGFSNAANTSVADVTMGNVTSKATVTANAFSLSSGMAIGSAATNSVQAFDAAGSATGATNAAGISSGLAAYAPTNRFDTNGMAVNMSTLTSNGVEAALGSIANQSTNRFAAVPGAATSGHFASFTGSTNVLADSGFGNSSFDASGAAFSVMGSYSNFAQGNFILDVNGSAVNPSFNVFGVFNPSSSNWNFVVQNNTNLTIAQTGQSASLTLSNQSLFAPKIVATTGFIGDGTGITNASAVTLQSNALAIVTNIVSTVSPTTTNAPAQFISGTLAMNGGATNVFHFKSFNGPAALTNKSDWVWFNLQNCYSNIVTTFICTNVASAASPTWQFQTNGFPGSPITTIVALTPIGQTTIVGANSGVTEWSFNFNGDAANFTGDVELPNVPVVVQSYVNQSSSSNAATLFNPTFLGTYNIAGIATQTSTTPYSNVMFRGQWFTQRYPRLPVLGIASWFGAFADTGQGVTNAVAFMKTNLLGYRWFEIDDGWGDTNLVNAQYMQLNSNLQATFGSGTNGVYNFITYFVTNNVNLILYADGGTNLSAGQLMHGMGGQYLTPNIDLWSRWGVAGLKIDMSEIEQEQAAMTVTTNGHPVYITGAADASFDNGGNGALSRVYSAMFNATRIVSGGDITSYPQLLRWIHVAQTNGWPTYVEPGRFIDLDFTGGEFNGGYGQNSVKSHLIGIAIFSSPQLLSGGLGQNFPWATNKDMLAIQQDPGVFCGNLVYSASNCEVYLKPLGTQNGPQYALAVFNLSSTSPTNISFYFTNIPTLALTGVQNWTPMDTVSNGVDGSSGRWLVTTNYLTVSLNTNEAALYRIVPGVAFTTNVIAVNYPYSMTVNVISNGVPFTCYVPLDAMSSNYLTAAQLTNNTSQEPFEIAAAETTALGTAHGWLAQMDILHLYMGGTSNSTAQNFVSQTVGAITWTSSGVTYNNNSVTGNGSSGYGTTTFNPSGNSQNFQTNSGMMFSWVKSTSVIGDNFMMGADNNGTLGAGISVRNGPTSFEAYGINAAVGFNASLEENWIVDGVTGNCSGWWMAQRTGTTTQNVFHNTFNGATDNSTSSSAFPGFPFYFLAINSGNSSASDPFGGTIGCDGVRASMTTAQWIQMLSDLQTIKQIAGN